MIYEEIFENLGVQILKNFQLIVPHESSINKVLDLIVELNAKENYYFIKSKSKSSIRKSPADPETSSSLES